MADFVLCLQACLPVILSSPVTVKNHNEILRCFAVISECRDEHCFIVLAITFGVLHSKRVLQQSRGLPFGKARN